MNFLFLVLFFAISEADPSASNYYSRLGLPNTALPKDIKSAYRKLAVKFHPDRNKDENASDLFARVNEAYEVLSDSDKRKTYDRYGEDGLKNTNQQRHYQDPMDIFRQFFHGNMQQQHKKGPDVTMDIWVTLRGVLKGKKVKIDISSTSFKSKVLQHDVFEFDIPNGVKDGTQFVKESCLPDLTPRNRYAYAIDDDDDDAIPGDIKFRIRIKEDPYFKRENDNLKYTQYIGLAHALLGFDYKLQHVDGSLLSLKRKSITHNGYTQVFKGKGLGGDLFVVYEIVMPTELTDNQLELIKQAFSK